jgi:hypothetical protein
MRLSLSRAAMLAVAGLVACKPSDILSVPAPVGTEPTAALQNQTGAEGVYNAAKMQVFNALGGQFELFEITGLFTDEFTYSGFTQYPNYATIDARISEFQSVAEAGDGNWSGLLAGRSSVFLALPLLQQYEPPTGQWMIGEGYALAGYSELLIAETFCSGTTLDRVVPGGGVQYGMPLTDDSLLGTAIVHFDSAVAAAHGNSAITNLAQVGLARALLDRGQYAQAASAAQPVPSGFVYDIALQPNGDSPPYDDNMYANGYEFSYARDFNVSDREGGNGLDFLSAHDPRLAVDSTLPNADNTGAWYLPIKFETNLSNIPLATALEARLIAAEAALKSGSVNTWLADLNALRNSGCSVSGTDTTCTVGSEQVAGQTVGLPSLQDPGTDSGRVSLMFRERAFWLFGTGERLGDLRRLMRQYGRAANEVYPTGVYANGENPNLTSPIPRYGTDVAITLPTPAGLAAANQTISNPHYRGCLASTTTP